MVSREKLLFVVLGVILIVSLAVVLINNQPLLEGKLKSSYKPGLSYDQDQAVTQSKKVYQDKQKLNINFEEGPCLTNDLLPDWVVDIAHNPRQKIDDLPANQCAAFLEGRAKHFVELDPQGNVIRVN